MGLLSLTHPTAYWELSGCGIVILLPWYLLAMVGRQGRSRQRELPWAADSLCWQRGLVSPGQLTGLGSTVGEKSIGIPASRPSCREVSCGLVSWCKNWYRDTQALCPAL